MAQGTSMDWSSLVYLPAQDQFARPVTFTPSASQPGADAYNARGIFNSGQINVGLEDGSIITDQETILDIRSREFSIPPVQNDTVYIGPDGDVPAEGNFQITNVWDNGGGEITLQLRLLTTAPLRVIR